MSLNGFNTTDLSSPRGAWTDLDQVEARPDRAFQAVNVRFRPGRVRTRDGYATALAVAGKVTSMHQWITSAINRLIFYEGSGVKMKNLLNSDATAALYTLSGRGASVGEAGDKAYIAVYDASGLGAGQARFVNPTVIGSPVDIAFPAPLQAVPVITAVGAGQCTAGSHRFGYLVESRSGFPGYPAPVTSGGVHAPVSFTVAPGGQSLQMSLTLTVAAPPVVVSAIMTRTDNLEKWFFCPGSRAIIAVAGSPTVTVGINISDEDLATTASSADANFSYLTQSQTSTGPFNPSVLIPYNRRMCYVVNDKVYISDIDDYEVVTEDRHVVQVPGKRRIVTGFPLRGSVYTLGPGWTYVSSDNGNDPREWPVPQEVSSAIGTLSPTGVEWRTAGDYAWIASESGLWFFSGQYSEKPISYQNSDFWRRINWGAASAVQVREHIKEQCVYVAAPLDAATEPSHILVWHFGMGMEPFTVDFSYDTFLGTFSSICPLQDPTTGAIVMWRGPSAAGDILKQTPGVYLDGALVIPYIYETGFLLPDALGVKRIGAVELSVEGGGSLGLTAFGKDHIVTATPEAITLSTAPGKSYRQRFSLNDENVTLAMYYGVTPGAQWFDLQGIRTYWKPYLRNR